MTRGAEFIMQRDVWRPIFVPENFSEAQRMVHDMISDFIAREIHPRLDEIDAMTDPSLIPNLLRKAGGLGMLGVVIPEEYGGMNLDFTTNLLFGEATAAGFCFATSIGAQTSLGSLPIVYYGNTQQKEKYLSKIASGEMLVAYCLTEANAGSDANSGRTKANLCDDGTHYILNGQKIWITNGGFADLFIVFAKIDDDKDLSAFIVERAFEGVSVGPEERKMGIKGSSTTPVYFDNCKVPAENLLSERGEGFKIALNILNCGRIKIGASAVGGCKIAINKSVGYANERHQFGKPIANFGAIKHKLAEMAVKCFAVESAVYRVGKQIDELYDKMVEEGVTSQEAKWKSIREFTVECSMLKVYGSEAMDYVSDEAIQIHGGMGYSAETGVERGYRDARITRIYEGTNEINRLLTIAELMKRAFKSKEISLVPAIKRATADVFTRYFFLNSCDETHIIDNLKRTFLFIAGRVLQKLKMTLIDEQEIIMNLADILIETYVAESAFLRVYTLKQQPNHDKEKLAFHEKMVKVLLYEALHKVRTLGEDVIMSFASPFEQRVMIRVLHKLVQPYRVNPKNLRREIADRLIVKNKYCF